MGILKWSHSENGGELGKFKSNTNELSLNLKKLQTLPLTTNLPNPQIDSN